jgi:hypothetical protein
MSCAQTELLTWSGQKRLTEMSHLCLRCQGLFDPPPGPKKDDEAHLCPQCRGQLPSNQSIVLDQNTLLYRRLYYSLPRVADPKAKHAQVTVRAKNDSQAKIIRKFKELLQTDKWEINDVLLPYMERIVRDHSPNGVPGNPQLSIKSFLAKPLREDLALVQRNCPRCGRMMIYYPNDPRLLCYECEPR